LTQFELYGLPETHFTNELVNEGQNPSERKCPVKQKYLISDKDGGKNLTITEYAEIDKDIFSILCEEMFETEELEEAAREGLNNLVTAFRTRNLFPPISTSIKIAEGLMEFLESSEKETVEVLIDETESLEHYVEPIDIIDDIVEAEDEQLDDLLDDTVDVYDEEIGIKKINSSIQMDEDELLDDNGDV
jgi:hypothetical protein